MSFLQNAVQQSKTDELLSKAPAKKPSADSLSLAELTRISKAQKESQRASNPDWITSTSRRRIPGSLIKRSTALAEAGQAEDDDLDNYASNLAAQTNKKILSSFRKSPVNGEEQYENDFTFGNEGAELPPKMSIFDANYEDQSFVAENEKNERNIADSINRDPMNYQNAFNSNIRGGITTNSGIASSGSTGAHLNLMSDSSFGTLFGNEKANVRTPKPGLATSSATMASIPPFGHTKSAKQTSECAVIVFGYDDSVFEEVIQHFQKFGTILEEFNTGDVSMSSPISPSKVHKKNYPIFIGKSWVKLTYGNASSAIRACRDNDLSIRGEPINVIPYSREVLEKFLNGKINTQEDIGDTLNDLDIITLKKVPGNFEPLLQGTPVMDTSKRNKNVLMNTTIKMRNGSDLFVNVPKKPVAKEEAKSVNGLVKKATDMLFGFGEL